MSERCLDSMCTLGAGNHPEHYDKRDGKFWENYGYEAPAGSGVPESASEWTCPAAGSHPPHEWRVTPEYSQPCAGFPSGSSVPEAARAAIERELGHVELWQYGPPGDDEGPYEVDLTTALGAATPLIVAAAVAEERATTGRRIEAVLTLHHATVERDVTYHDYEDGCTACEDGIGHDVQCCAHCMTTDNDGGEYAVPMFWPCPTAKALGVEDSHPLPLPVRAALASPGEGE